MTLPIVRRALLSGACAILLAGCGGDEAEPAAEKTAAAPADSAAAPSFSTPATALPATPADSAAPNVPAADPAAVRTRDSALAAQILDAPVQGPVNAQALQGYQLTMEDVRKLGQSAQNLGALLQRRPELRDSLSVGAFDPNTIFDRLTSIPEAREAVAQAGMTPRQYVTVMSALTQAALVLAMRENGRTLPAQVQVNEANVEFLKENREEIRQYMATVGAQVRPRS